MHAVRTTQQMIMASNVFLIINKVIFERNKTEIRNAKSTSYKSDR